MLNCVRTYPTWKRRMETLGPRFSLNACDWGVTVRIARQGRDLRQRFLRFNLVTPSKLIKTSSSTDSFFVELPKAHEK
jgi:hypothetical protein